MAKLFQQTKLPYWRIKIANVDLTSELKYYVAEITVEYETKKGINKAEIHINSKSYIEDYFVEGAKIEIWFDWSPTSLVKMFEGNITVPPQGAADQKISYVIVANGTAGQLGSETKQRVFPIPKKPDVVNQIIAENGFTPYVQIADNLTIPAENMPMQRNMTDLQYLLIVADRWDCLTWVDDEKKIIYFIDSDKAHDLGNQIKIPNISDLTYEYELGYRTTGRKNNVASISWTFNKSQGIGQAVEGVDEDGAPVTEFEDFEIEIEGVMYKLKPEVKKDFTLARKALELATQSQLSGNAFQATKKYFVPVKSLTSRTNKNKGHASSFERRGVKLSINLNVGDPYLRPPRVCTIKSGTQNPKADNADLPAFLFTTNTLQKYNINKVKTSIINGMMQTSLEATR